MWYKLDEFNNTIPCASSSEYCEWERLNPEKRRIGRDNIGRLLVSTVFLGLDHGYYGDILLFETMIFNGDGEELYQDRYTTYKDALEQHEEIVKTLMKKHEKL